MPPTPYLGARRGQASNLKSTPPLREQGLRQQIYLGDEGFVARMQALECGEPQLQKKIGIPRVQGQIARTKALRQYLAECSCRE